MRIKKMLSALLAAVMVFGLLCVPASALEVLPGPDDSWMDGYLDQEITISRRFWTSENGVITKNKDAEKPVKTKVFVLPLGSSLTVGPSNQWVNDASVYSDPDGDGIYDERLDRLAYDEDGTLTGIETVPAAENGPFTATRTIGYSNRYDWGWGLNTFENEYNSRNSFNGYRTLTADYVLKVFGPNTLIELYNGDGTARVRYLFPGEKPNQPMTYDRLEDHGVYFANDNSDVVSKWAVEPVDAAAEAGLISYEMERNHKFNLTGKITRAEFANLAVMLYETMSGKAAPSGGNPFEDVDENNVFYKSILEAYELKIVTGKTDTLFRPDALVTRQEAAAMLARVYTNLGGAIPTVAATSFADNTDIQGYARNAVAFMSSKGIISGVGSNRFNPTGNASVEQALKIAVEMLNKLS